MTRHVLDESKIHPAVRQKISENHRDFVDEAVAAVAKHDVVVLGMAVNPSPGRALRMLRSKGLAPHYIGHGSYLSGWRRRNALKMWTGWPTFPMVFVKGTLVGGASDLQALIASGELDKMLAAPRAQADQASTVRA
jgi:monothiol glutaredoxin